MSVDEKDVLLMSFEGLVSQDDQEDVVVQGSGLSGGDKRRNVKLARLRELVPTDNAILGSRPSWSLIMIRGCWPGGG